MLRLVAAAILPLVFAVGAWGEQRYRVTGVVLKIDRAHSSFVASCSEIPGYMVAMVMPIPVRDIKLLDKIATSSFVDFTLVVTGDDSYAENLAVHHYQSNEQEPVAARRLQLLEALGSAGNAVRQITPGERVPDFTMTDQAGRTVNLSEFAGKTVVAAFIYTRCPLPNYCFRLSNNLGRIRNRFPDRMGRDLILLSITMDPAHDTPDVMAKYATTWKGDGNSWRFLTGPAADVESWAGRFGVSFWADEGSLTHSLHTILIDRQGKLAANLEGNDFTAEQLGDVVQALLDQR